MKARAIIKTADDVERERAEKAASDEARKGAAKQRKAHMLALEAKRIANAPLSTLEQEKKDANKKRVGLASFQMDEELDDVKTMSRYMRYAQTVAIRDKQVAEKKEREARDKEVDRIRDLEMEIDRLKQIKMHKAREEVRREKLVKDREMIEVQIRARAKKQEAARAEVRREQEEKKRLLERQAEEEKEELVRQQDRQRKHLADVMAANDAAILAKKKRREDEVEEDRKIMLYLKNEDAKRKKREEEEEALKAARELEIAKLRAQQQKMADKDAELDALRAKRHFEAAERDFRKKQLELARKAAASQEELMRAREQQRKDKEWAMALVAKQQKEEFERNLAVALEAQEKVVAEERDLLTKNHGHKDEILHMIAVREGERKSERKEYLKQGAAGKAVIATDVGRVKAIRDRKVAELMAQGVPEKYTVQLAKYDPEDVLSKDYKLGGRIPTIS